MSVNWGVIGWQIKVLQGLKLDFRLGGFTELSNTPDLGGFLSTQSRDQSPDYDQGSCKAAEKCLAQHNPSEKVAGQNQQQLGWPHNKTGG